MANTALITGASSGIGAALAKYHASKGGDLIITARRQDRLEALKSDIEGAHGVTVHVVPSDLGASGGADQLYSSVKALDVPIDILVNNAGLGGYGTIIERDLADDQAMIDLNVKALVALTTLFGADMVMRGGGRILQVGSTAGFMPGPYQAVYFATKAFVNSYSQAVDHELRSKGVTSSVLVPGYVETEFAQAAQLEGTPMVKQGGRSAEATAKIAYDGMMRGDLVIFNQADLRILMGWVIPLMPRRMALKMIERMQRKT